MYLGTTIDISLNWSENIDHIKKNIANKNIWCITSKETF